MFNGKVVPTRADAFGIAVCRADGYTESYWPAWQGSLPGTLGWSEHYHGPIPPGWRIISRDASWDSVEIAGEWYAPTLRLVALARITGKWLAWGGTLARMFWRERPRMAR